MASLHKDPRGKSPYWYAAFYGADGSRCFKSTKTSDRRQATRICTEWESAALRARKKTLTTAQVRSVFNEILEQSGDEPLESLTIGEWMAEWLATKKSSHAPSTWERYRKPVEDFIAHLGSRAALPLRAATSKDIRKFRDEQRGAGRAAATVNFSHKALASAFEAAKRQAYIEANPCHAVDYLPTHEEKVEKGIFNAKEVSALLRVANSRDWQGVILVGYYTGLRLSDCLSLSWASVDLQARVLKVTPKKTVRRGVKLEIPMSLDLEEFFIAHPVGKRDTDPVFPSLAKLSAGGNRGGSRLFQRIMKDAGLESGSLRGAAGEAGRAVADRSFHSLRHSYITALSTAGVAVEIRQKLVGHSSAEQNLHYTHAELASLRTAVESLPRISKAI
ncbi:MAG: tyrosine-type recombinase/integrase [Verrucomicrobia bacterium]|nr:tyrosine-type recombinase/integrase [Verrucomicrobiota bacterium]